MAYLSNIERMGFISAEIKAFLSSNDIHIQDAQEAEEKPDKPLATRERNTLLTIIAALCNEAKMDYKKPAKTAALIVDKAEKMGLSIGESTIEGHLKKVPDALETRMK